MYETEVENERRWCVAGLREHLVYPATTYAEPSSVVTLLAEMEPDSDANTQRVFCQRSLLLLRTALANRVKGRRYVE